MSNNTAKGNTATQCSGTTGEVAPHDACNNQQKVQSILSDYFGFGVSDPVRCISNMLHFTSQHDLTDRFRQEIIFESTRLINLLVELNELVD